MDYHFYTPKYQNVIQKYQLTQEQLRYTGTPTDAVKVAEEDQNRFPILVFDKQQFVTFFVLHMKEGCKPYSTNPQAILIRTFSTDFRYQGHGYASRAMKGLPQWVADHFPDINEIILAVNIRNLQAQRLYEKAGFIDHGVRVMGPKGELIVMSYGL